MITLNEAKILLALSKNQKLNREGLATASLESISELDSSISFLESQGLIIKNLEVGFYGISENGVLNLEEYVSEFHSYEIQISEVCEQNPAILNMEAHGSVICFRLQNSEHQEINTHRMCLRSVITTQALRHVNFKDSQSAMNIVHWSALKNFERFVLNQIPDFQLVYSSNNPLNDFEISYCGLITRESKVHLFGKITQEEIESFCAQKSLEYNRNEMEGNKDKNRTGILRNASCIPYGILIQ
jgi:hypothetical protein